MPAPKDPIKYIEWKKHLSASLKGRENTWLKGVKFTAQHCRNLSLANQIHKPFSLDNFNDGYIALGRFRVYLPNHPRANRGGYVLRALVAYEAYHNTAIPENMSVHHIDRNPLNDSKNNLELMEIKKHQRLHHPPTPEIIKNCKYCGKEFKIKPWRLKEEGRKNEFCSRRCGMLNRWHVDKSVLSHTIIHPRNDNLIKERET